MDDFLRVLTINPITNIFTFNLYYHAMFESVNLIYHQNPNLSHLTINPIHPMINFPLINFIFF